jgi:DNA-binding transcriptional regulator YhcF (GntR family)
MKNGSERQIEAHVKIDRTSPIPVYIQIEQIFDHLIFQKELGPHELLPSVPMLAERLGVGSLTVQKAYRRLVDRGLVYSIVGKGTFVAEAGDQEFVALLVHNDLMMEPGLTPTLPLVVQGIRERLEEASLPSQILTDSYSHLQSPAAISPDVMDVLRRRRPTGILLLNHSGSDELFDLAAERSIPVIGYERPCPRADARIRWENDGMLRSAAERLKERGVSRTGVLWLDVGNSPQVQMASLQRMKNLVNEGGLQTRQEWIVGAHQASNWAGYHAMNYLWDLPDRPDGLIITDDVLGQGAAMAMLSRKIDSKELQVAAHSNAGSPIQFDPTWDCCQFNPAAAARMMVAQLRKRLAGEPAAGGDIVMPFTWREAAAPRRQAVFVSVGNHLHERENLFRNGRELTTHLRRGGTVLKA